jgi:xanthine/CO dehydrogenase XdhC/CoxF family maturation factor
VPLDHRTVAVVMTHHYRHDLPLLRQLLPQPLAYLGLLGPLQRAERILADLAAEGLEITPAMRARLHAPVGLDLGGKTPESVAVAILAEIESTLAGRAARPLRERKGPIHG